MSDWNGLLLIDKAPGPTSHDIVGRLRRIAGERRIGHGGTLDPLASGLLPLVLGRATRLVRFLPHSPKIYTGEFRLGAVSSTDDAQGRIREVADPAALDPQEVLGAAAGFIGVQAQRPPAVSARKVGGERLYRLARRGVAVEAPAKEVHILRFDLSASADPGRYRFVAEVSGGTYIRALVRDLGQSLGCGALLTELRRTAIGGMQVGEAVALGGEQDPSVERLRLGLIAPVDMPLDPPSIQLADGDSARRFRGGCAIVHAETGTGEWRRVLAPSGRLLGVARQTEGRLRPKVVIDPL